jgi:hypothetical protein
LRRGTRRAEGPDHAVRVHIRVVCPVVMRATSGGRRGLRRLSPSEIAKRAVEAAETLLARV